MTNGRYVDDQFFDEPDSGPRQGFREDEDAQLSRREARQNRTTGRIFPRRRGLFSSESAEFPGHSSSSGSSGDVSDAVVHGEKNSTETFVDDSFDVTEEYGAGFGDVLFSEDAAATHRFEDGSFVDETTQFDDEQGSSWAPNYVANSEFDAYYDQLGATEVDVEPVSSAGVVGVGSRGASVSRRGAVASDSGEWQYQERVISQMHGHPFRLFLPALLTIGASGAAAYFFGFFQEDWENWAVLAAGVAIVLLFGLLPLLFWLSTNYTITTRRVVIRRGFLTQIRQELLHSRSYDVTVRRGPFQRLFGSGDVLINAGLDSPIVLNNVQDVVLVQNVLQELMERSASSVAHRRQRGEASPGRR